MPETFLVDGGQITVGLDFKDETIEDTKTTVVASNFFLDVDLALNTIFNPTSENGMHMGYIGTDQAVGVDDTGQPAIVDSDTNLEINLTLDEYNSAASSLFTQIHAKTADILGDGTTGQTVFKQFLTAMFPYDTTDTNRAFKQPSVLATQVNENIFLRPAYVDSGTGIDTNQVGTFLPQAALISLHEKLVAASRYELFVDSNATAHCNAKFIVGDIIAIRADINRGGANASYSASESNFLTLRINVTGE